jgi:hypothetical protein
MVTTHLSRIRKAALGGAAAAAVALPLALTSAPAQAATLNGCTVTPLAPVKVGQIGNVPIYRFSTRVSCVKDRIVQIIDQRWESDPPAGVAGDQSYGTTTYLRTFAVAGAITLSVNDAVTNTEVGWEEVYHRTAFRVASIGGVTPFTPFQNSPLVAAAV